MTKYTSNAERNIHNLILMMLLLARSLETAWFVLLKAKLPYPYFLFSHLQSQIQTISKVDSNDAAPIIKSG